MYTVFNDSFGNTASNDRVMTDGMERGRKLSWPSLKVLLSTHKNRFDLTGRKKVRPLNIHDQ
jgi:hypothetical protein